MQDKFTTNSDSNKRANNYIQPTHNSARLFAYGFAIVAQTPHSGVVG